MDRVKRSLFAASESKDQDGRHAHIYIWFKVFSPEPVNRFPRNLIIALGTRAIIVCSNDNPRISLTYFMARSNYVT